MICFVTCISSGGNCDEDIDECANSTGLCGSGTTGCMNMPGTYKCPCQDGFQAHNTTHCLGWFSLVIFTDSFILSELILTNVTYIDTDWCYVVITLISINVT